MVWTVTDHASRRIRKRLGISKSAVRRIVDAAENEGLKSVDVSGSLRRYMDSFYFNSHPSNRVVVHNNYAFCLCDDTLITVLLLPGKFRRGAALRKVADSQR